MSSPGRRRTRLLDTRSGVLVGGDVESEVSALVAKGMQRGTEMLTHQRLADHS